MRISLRPAARFVLPALGLFAAATFVEARSAFAQQPSARALDLGPTLPASQPDPVVPPKTAPPTVRPISDDSRPVPAPSDPQPDKPPVVDQEAEALRDLERLRGLVLPQQRQIARRIIAKYPQTRVARLAQELIDEYDRYAALHKPRDEREAAWTADVRSHWDSRRLEQPPAYEHPPGLIRNASAIPVLYELRGPQMRWSGPYRLAANQQHRFRYPAEIRFFSQGELRTQFVHPGGLHEFRTDENRVELRSAIAPIPLP